MHVMTGYIVGTRHLVLLRVAVGLIRTADSTLMCVQ